MSVTSERAVHHRVRLAHDGVQVRLVLEALRVDLVDVLRTRRARGEPAAAGYDLQAADRRVVARGASQLSRDRLAGKLRFADGLGRELFEPRLLLGCGRRIDARVVRRAQLRGQRTVVLARVLPGARRDLRGQEGHDRAVLVGGPYRAVSSEEAGPRALLAAEAEGTIEQ